MWGLSTEEFPVFDGLSRELQTPKGRERVLMALPGVSELWGLVTTEQLRQEVGQNPTKK